MEVIPPSETEDDDLDAITTMSEPAEGVETTQVPTYRTVRVAIVGDSVRDDEDLNVQTIEMPEPSLTGIDRSHWTRTRVSPASGVTHHCPIIFSDCTIHHDYGDLYAPTVEARLEAALNGAESGGYDLTNLAATGAQPLKFALDLVTFPAHLVLDPYHTP